MFPRVSVKEAEILRLLIANGEMYGMEMVQASGGVLKPGTIYVTLGRMDDKDFVTSRVEKVEGATGLPRRLFTVTSRGRRAMRAYHAAVTAFGGVVSSALS